MKTPSHSIINVAILGKKRKRDYNAAIFAGSFLPDVPIVLFAVGGAVQKRGFEQMWREDYFSSGVQMFVSGFHSVPIALGGFLLARYLKKPLFAVFFASMLLHDLLDFPVHNVDAHMHFYPFSSWRFISPLSYWDPQHYGNVVSLVEFLIVLISSYFVLRKINTRLGKLAVLGTNFLYLAALISFRLIRG